ncbi:MAG: right-handed parallel beta-helix repeat-containing protein, partial [Anaerolineae bacterium]
MAEKMSKTPRKQPSGPSAAPLALPSAPTRPAVPGVERVLLLAASLAFGLLLGFGVLVPLRQVQAAPIGSIQDLIDHAPAGGTVNISAGVYNESLTVNKTLTLTGITSSTTIIQAAAGQRVITVTAGSSLRLVNLTLTGGQTADSGGGVFVANGSLALVNCVISNNSAAYGGGVFQADASGRVDAVGSRIERNTAAWHGGGLYVNGSAALTDTQVLSNTATWHGGGLHVQSGQAELVGGALSNNRALNGNGGAVNVNNSLTISGTQIISNAAVSGGGLQQWNAGPAVQVTNSRFERNTARVAGGGAAISGTLLISNSTFATNTVDSGSDSSTYGGGLCASADAQVIDSTFAGNSALCIYGGSCYHADGGGLYTSGASLALSGVTFTGNEAGRSGGGVNSSYGSLAALNV